MGGAQTPTNCLFNAQHLPVQQSSFYEKVAFPVYSY